MSSPAVRLPKTSPMLRLMKLQRLLDIRTGPGAAKLPADLTRIHMDFHVEGPDEHAGARDFWKAHLRRLKYHNPAVPMTVSRKKDPTSPCLMSLYFAQDSATKPTTSSSTSSPSKSSPSPDTKSSSPSSPKTNPGERMETLSMRGLPAAEIMQRVAKLTGAQTVAARSDDAIMLEEVRAYEAEMARRAVINQAAAERRSREKAAQEAFIARARGEA